jgi:broad specificity phosphatase PhoE
VPLVNRLLLVRHGENPANLTKEFSHRKVDYSLTHKGLLQARQTAEHLARLALDGVWSSPLKRAAETAAEAARPHARPVQILEDLREMDVGTLEGMESLERAWALYAEVMRAWLGGDPGHRFPGGESRTELNGRFRRALETITKDQSDKTFLVVGHGGIFFHGVAELCGIEDQKAFFGKESYNCSISTVDSIVEAGAQRFVLVDWASIAHLSGEAAQMVESVPESARAKNL